MTEENLMQTPPADTTESVYKGARFGAKAGAATAGTIGLFSGAASGFTSSILPALMGAVATVAVVAVAAIFSPAIAVAAPAIAIIASAAVGATALAVGTGLGAAIGGGLGVVGGGVGGAAAGGTISASFQGIKKLFSASLNAMTGNNKETSKINDLREQVALSQLQLQAAEQYRVEMEAARALATQKQQERATAQGSVAFADAKDGHAAAVVAQGGGVARAEVKDGHAAAVTASISAPTTSVSL